MTANHPFVPSAEGTTDRCVAEVAPDGVATAVVRLCGRAKLDPAHDTIVNLDAEATPEREWAFDPNDMPEDLNAAVFQAVGGASACWQNLRGAGVFWDSKARDVAEALIEWVNAHYEEVGIDDLPRAEVLRLANDAHEAHAIASQAADTLRAGIAEVLGYRPEDLNRPGDVMLIGELRQRRAEFQSGKRVPGQVEFGPSGGMSAP